LNEKYKRNLEEVEENISALQQIITKPFGKAEELQLLKKDIARIEREISLKMQENQMKPQEKKNEEGEINEAPVIQMEPRKISSVKSLLPQNENVFIKRSMKI